MLGGPKYEVVKQTEGSKTTCKPIPPSSVQAVVVQHTDNGALAIANFVTVEDAMIFQRALDGFEATARERPQLTDTYMAQSAFAKRLLDFLGSRSGEKLRKQIVQEICQKE